MCKECNLLQMSTKEYYYNEYKNKEMQRKISKISNTSSIFESHDKRKLNKDTFKVINLSKRNLERKERFEEKINLKTLYYKI